MSERPRDALGRPLSDSAEGAVPGVDLSPELSSVDALTAAGAYLLQDKPFHAHEVFELRWRTAPASERALWRALAQWGAALTHDRRGNPVGAQRLMHRAADGLAATVTGDAPAAPLAPASPILAAGDFVLTEIRESDRDDLVKCLSDSDIQLWNPGHSAGDVPGAVDRILNELVLPSADGLTWLVRRADAPAGPLVGRISLHHVNLANVQGEVGYWTAPWARGCGVSTAAVSAVAEYGVKTLGLRRIELYHGLTNEASCRVAARCGFELEGTLRSSYIYGDGARHDEHVHAFIAE